MVKFYEYCPKCQGIRRMSTSIALKKVPARSGGVLEILVTNYHCDTCSSFVCSRSEAEEVEMQTAGYYEMEPSQPLN